MNLRIVLAIHIDLDADEDERHVALVKVRVAAYEVQAFFRRYYPDTKVMGILAPADREPATPYRYGDWNLPEMKAAYAMLPESDKFPEQPTHWHMWGGNEPNTCGRAPKPGTVGMTYKYCPDDTMKHELGHNLGLGHDNQRRLTADGYVTVRYGGESILASGDDRIIAFNGPHMGYLGLLDATEITTSREILLCPLELPEYGRHAQETPLARAGGMCFYSYDGEIVYCSELLASRASVQYSILRYPGEVVPLLEGLAVEHGGSVDGSVLITVMMDGNEPIPVARPLTRFPVAA
jgi:hypothetical protein